MKDNDFIKVLESIEEYGKEKKADELSAGEYMLLRNIAKTDIKNKLNFIIKLIDKFL